MEREAHMTRPLRVGIISAKWGAMGHLPAWRLIPDVEVTAMCTSRQETAEAAVAQHGIARPFWDFEAMCADPDIDIIDVGSSPILRESMVAAAIRAGKHVVNNMPFATSGKAADRLAALQQDACVVGGAASSLAGLPHLALMKEMIEAGEIGEVFQIDAAFQLSFFLEIMPGFPYLWFGKAGLGVSVTRNHGSHILHALRYLNGPISSVVARMETQLKSWNIPGEGPRAAETDDTCHALLGFANGAMGSMRTSWTAADSPGFSLDVFGSKGRLKLDALLYPSVSTAKLYASTGPISMVPTGSEVIVPDRLLSVAGRRVEPSAADMMNGGQTLSLARVFESVVAEIRGTGQAMPNFARAAEIQRLIDALYASHAARAWIDL